MKKIFRPIIFFSISILCLHAQSQSLKNVESNNGFKKYKLGSKYQSVYGIKSKVSDGSEMVFVNYTTDKIGDIPVKTIELYYIKDLLAKIIVNFAPENNSKLIEACKNSFGSPTQDLSDNETSRKLKNNKNNRSSNYLDNYLWKTKKINLEYYYFYPTISGDPYSKKDLHLSYTLTDYSSRLERSKKGNYSPKDF